jgi:uncharacterized repeat protein (TIGR02543 family)
VPNPGYAFVNWSDASTANPRTDAGVTNNITVTANFAATPPVIVLTTPTNNASYILPATITLTAAVTTNGNVINQVRFYDDGTNLLGTVATEPYVFVWTNAVAGSHSLTAEAAYNTTNTISSVAVNVSVIAPVQPVICGPLTWSGGAFSFSFTGTNGQPYRILCATNPALPMTNWVELSGGTFGAGAVFYTDPAATNNFRFYRIVSP